MFQYWRGGTKIFGVCVGEIVLFSAKTLTVKLVHFGYTFSTCVGNLLPSLKQSSHLIKIKKKSIASILQVTQQIFSCFWDQQQSSSHQPYQNNL